MSIRLGWPRSRIQGSAKGAVHIVHIINRGMIPVVAVRLPKKDKETGLRLYDGTYVEDGRPLCDCGKPTEYIETDPE